MLILLQNVIYMEEIPSDYIIEADGMRLIVIGKINQSFGGCACPMSVLTHEFLKKLNLNANEIAIADKEAGIEHFGRGVESSIDAVVAVMKASLESINLAEKIANLTSGAKANFAGVVVNKAGSDNLYEKTREELEKRGLPHLGKIPYSESIVEACFMGQTIELAYSGDEIIKIIEKLQITFGFGI